MFLVGAKNPMHKYNINVMSIKTFAVSICTRILKYRVWKIEFDELGFLSISNLTFAGYTGSKNLVQTRQKFQFIKLDFSISIFQNPSADRYRDRVISRFDFNPRWCTGCLNLFFGMKWPMIFGIRSIENLCKDIFFECPPYLASTTSYLIDVGLELNYLYFWWFNEDKL